MQAKTFRLNFIYSNRVSTNFDSVTARAAIVNFDALITYGLNVQLLVFALTDPIIFIIITLIFILNDDLVSMKYVMKRVTCSMKHRLPH